VKRPTKLATLLAALAAGLGATALPAQAAVSSASIDELTATLNLDGASDNVTVSVSGGLLVHGQTSGGLASGSDWDSATDGDQTVPADGTRTVIVNGGDGNDAITVVAKTTELDHAMLNGDGGDDVITGPDTADTLTGGDGNDRLIGGRGKNLLMGGAGNDSFTVRDGKRDRVDCGPGKDSVTADKRDVLRHCERIRRSR
jgi:Ca2+-binding RTX toxin-like protein